MYEEIGIIDVGKRGREKKHKFWVGVWEIYHFDKDNRLIWKEEVENALADEGEESMLDVYLRGAAAPTNFYLGLANDTPNDQTTLATLQGEPSGNGYARQQIERSGTGWPVFEKDENNDWRATSKLVTFTASGGSIGPVNLMFLTDVASGTSGKFLAWAALSQSRTLSNGESLGCKIKIKLS